jgi:hypothetical protein
MPFPIVIGIPFTDATRIRARGIDSGTIDLCHTCSDKLNRHGVVGLMSLTHSFDGNSDGDVVLRIFDPLCQLFHFRLVGEFLTMLL